MFVGEFCCLLAYKLLMLVKPPKKEEVSKSRNSRGAPLQALSPTALPSRKTLTLVLFPLSSTRARCAAQEGVGPTPTRLEPVHLGRPRAL